ncbi:BJ4_G0054570.mRNA.1.CDS.1 [Saccharomyces cerevisiae]|nr:BJ4_G0054570.mRNA.1.CDS.1 [Saccharomyces cerevisiae]
MDDICSIAENINRTLFNILGTEIDEINLNTNNLYNFIMESNLTKVEQHTLHKNISNNRLEIYHHIKKEKSPKGKSSISPQARAFLEQVFRRKQSLNSKEKEEVAKKCGITPLQVRVWHSRVFLLKNVGIKINYHLLTSIYVTSILSYTVLEDDANDEK